MVDFPDVRVRRRGLSVGTPCTTLHSPKEGHEDWLKKPATPGACIAKAYDVVLNGIELGWVGAYPPRGRTKQGVSVRTKLMRKKRSTQICGF